MSRLRARIFEHPEHTMIPPESTHDRSDVTGYIGLNGAELRAQREVLGLSARDLAECFGCNLRSLQRWEAGFVPGWAVLQFMEIIEETDSWQAQLEDHSGVVMMFHEGWHITDIGKALPASWWRALVGQALLKNTMLFAEWGD